MYPYARTLKWCHKCNIRPNTTKQKKSKIKMVLHSNASNPLFQTHTNTVFVFAYFLHFNDFFTLTIFTVYLIV